jgi:hypothetical protein
MPAIGRDISPRSRGVVPDSFDMLSPGDDLWVGDYDGYGAVNAAARLASQSQAAS